MKKVESINPADWTAFADQDLAAAKTLFKDSESFPHIIAMHCHQAVEKYLKAALLFYKKEKPKIHDLVALVNYCADAEPSFRELLQSAKDLDPLYVEERYPFTLPQLSSDEELESFIQAAEKIRDFVLSKIQ